MTNCSITLRFSELKNDSKMARLCSITLLTMVAQQQPKSLQCNYLLKHASQPQTVTVNNQLRTKWSSDFVMLRSKVQELYLLNTVSCGQKRHSRLLLSCWKMNRPEKTQSAAFTYDPDDPTRVPRRHGILEVLAPGGKNLRRSEKTHLEDKLLKNEPVRKDAVGCF